jgi:hypothetical protein
LISWAFSDLAAVDALAETVQTVAAWTETAL